MRRFINISLVFLSGLIVIYHRMIEPLNIEIILLPMLMFSIIMYFVYDKTHRYSYLYVLIFMVISGYAIFSEDFGENIRLNQYFSFLFFLITMSLFVASTVVAFRLVKDRNIKKRINKLLYVYAVWILIFHSPITEFLTQFISDFSGPIPNHITSALRFFWLTSDIWYIIVILIQVYIIYLSDNELSYRLEKIQLRKEEARRQKASEKDIFGYGKDFYEKEY